MYTLKSTCRHTDHALYLQSSDEWHFTGRPFTGKMASRQRIKPEQHLLPVAAESRKFLVRLVQNQYDVTEGDILSELSEYVVYIHSPLLNAHIDILTTPVHGTGKSARPTALCGLHPARPAPKDAAHTSPGTNGTSVTSGCRRTRCTSHCEKQY